MKHRKKTKTIALGYIIIDSGGNILSDNSESRRMLDSLSSAFKTEQEGDVFSHVSDFPHFPHVPEIADIISSVVNSDTAAAATVEAENGKEYLFSAVPFHCGGNNKESNDGHQEDPSPHERKIMLSMMEESPEIETSPSVKKLQQEIDQLKEQLIRKNSVIRVITHDLRTPYSAFHSFLTLLQTKYKGLLPDQITPMLEELYAIFLKGELLLKNLQYVSHDIYGNTNFNRSILSLDEVIASVQDESAASILLTAEKKGISIKWNNEQDVLILGDSEILSTVLQNLLSLAAALGDSGSTINISTAVKKQSVRMSICYTGTPIDPRLSDAAVQGNWGASPDADIGIDTVGFVLSATSWFLRMQDCSLVIDSKLKTEGCFTLNLLRFKKNA
ncbi:MAG: HAMP domain-containing histidine kinase [Spirochaetia bacterium]|nr:HAMP domain-containing histidine kinase [Spirochaetia bacterium]